MDSPATHRNSIQDSVSDMTDLSATELPARLGIGGGVTSMRDYYIERACSPRINAPGHAAVVDAKQSNPITDKLTGTFDVNNLLDRKYVLRVGSVGTFKARAEDYTPNAENRQRLPGLESPPSDSADDFLGVIEHELKLLIAKRYTVEVRRQALFGHSYCGLFTLYTLLTKSQAFQGCGRQSVDLVVQGLSRTHARSVRTAARGPACRRAHGRQCRGYGRPSAAAFQLRSAQRIPAAPRSQPRYQRCSQLCRGTGAGSCHPAIRTSKDGESDENRPVSRLGPAQANARC